MFFTCTQSWTQNCRNPYFTQANSHNFRVSRWCQHWENWLFSFLKKIYSEVLSMIEHFNYLSLGLMRLNLALLHLLSHTPLSPLIQFLTVQITVSKGRMVDNFHSTSASDFDSNDILCLPHPTITNFYRKAYMCAIFMFAQLHCVILFILSLQKWLCRTPFFKS